MLRSITMAAILVLCACATAAFSGVRVPVSPRYDLVIEVDARPEIGEWEPTAAALGGGFIASSTGGYALTGTPDDGGMLRLVLKRQGGGDFTVSKLQAWVTLPLEGIAAEWDTQIPPFGTMFRRVPELEFSTDTRANVGIPLVVLVDAYGNNKFAAGFVEQSYVCNISGERRGDRYVLALTRLAGDSDKPVREYASTLYLSQAPDYWFEAVRKYSALADSASGYKPRPIPTSAYGPVFSTVYAYGDDISQDRVWKAAVEAKKLGMTQIVLDSGWSNAMGWADPGNDYGTYEPVKSKFPDFRGLVKRIHDELGMRVILWISPTWIGRQSANYERLKDFRVKWPNGDYDRNLCPRTPEARQYLIERLSDLAAQHRIDGFWIDYLDTCPTVCDAPHRHDISDYAQAMNTMLEGIYQAVAKSNKNATVEYRVPYGNLFTKRHANVFETTDAPGDWSANMLMGTFVRAYSNGVVVKGDPVHWKKDAHCEEVARNCMTAITLGVPAFSVDLIDMEQSRKDAVAAWIRFYDENREDLLKGRFSPFGASFHYPDLKIVADKQAFVYLPTRKTRVIRIEKLVETLHILNVNPPEHGQLRIDVEGLPDGRYTGKYYDCSRHSDRQEEFVSINGRMKLHTDMPTGGALTLTRQ